MNPNLKSLRAKWLPILKQSKITFDQLIQFRNDVEKFKASNPNWQNQGQYIPVKIN